MWRRLRTALRAAPSAAGGHDSGDKQVIASNRLVDEDVRAFGPALVGSVHPTLPERGTSTVSADVPVPRRAPCGAPAEPNAMRDRARAISWSRPLAACWYRNAARNAAVPQPLLQFGQRRAGHRSHGRSGMPKIVQPKSGRPAAALASFHCGGSVDGCKCAMPPRAGNRRPQDRLPRNPSRCVLEIPHDVRGDSHDPPIRQQTLACPQSAGRRPRKRPVPFAALPRAGRCPCAATPRPHPAATRTRPTTAPTHADPRASQRRLRPSRPRSPGECPAPARGWTPTGSGTGSPAITSSATAVFRIVFSRVYARALTVGVCGASVAHHLRTIRDVMASTGVAAKVGFRWRASR